MSLRQSRGRMLSLILAQLCCDMCSFWQSCGWFKIVMNIFNLCFYFNVPNSKTSTTCISDPSICFRCKRHYMVMKAPCNTYFHVENTNRILAPKACTWSPCAGNVAATGRWGILEPSLDLQVWKDGCYDATPKGAMHSCETPVTCLSITWGQEHSWVQTYCSSWVPI